VDDRFGYSCAELGHSLGKPLRHAAAVKRKVCGSRTFHAVILQLL
jgi:hypothetical protein